MSVEKRPNGQWRARYRDATGKEHAKHFTRKVEAERWLTSMRAALTRGDWIDPALAKITVGEWAAGWFLAQVQLKPSTRERYAAVLRNQIQPYWARVPLSAVNHSDVAAWVARLAGEGLSARSVHKAHRVLSLMLDMAVRDRRLSTNPAAGVKLPRADQPSKRFLSATQVRALAEAAGPDDVLIYVLAYCGLRFGELAALRARDVDLIRRRLSVERAVTDVNGRMVFGSPKTHHRRQVPLPRFLVDLLRGQLGDKEPDDLLFPSPNGSVLRANNFRRRSFDKASSAIGLDGLTPHELRHTAASLAVSAGANVKAVQRMLGHASAAMTLDVYAGLFGDDLDTLADQLDVVAGYSDADQMRTEPEEGDDDDPPPGVPARL